MFAKYETNRHNTWGEDELTCPHCGAKQEDTWEIDGSGGEDNEQEWECCACGKEFSFWFETKRTWTSHCKKHDLVTEEDVHVEEIGGRMCRYYQCRNCEYTNWLTREEAEEAAETIVEDKKLKL